MTKAPPRNWALGRNLLLIPPFIGLMIIFTSPPQWLEVVGVAAIIALVFAGSTLLFKRSGGWKPSETLPKDGGPGGH